MGDQPYDDLEEEPELGAVDISLCRLSDSDTVADNMRILVKELRGQLGFEDPDDVTVKKNPKPSDEDIKALFSKILAAHAASQSYFNWDFTDLYDFCRALREYCLKDKNIADNCKKVMVAIEGEKDGQENVSSPGMCLLNRNVGERVRNSQGVSIYFPWGEWEDAAMLDRYKDLTFLEISKWHKFLKEYRELAAKFENKDDIFKIIYPL